MKLKSKAFTLVEVLLVSVLIAVIGLAIFRCFVNGLKLWSKTQRLNSDAQVVIFLDKIAEDLRSTVVLSGFNFKGTGAQLSFPAVILTKADPKSSRAQEGLVNQIGAVKYRFDFEKHGIYRQQANYSYALKGKWQQEEVELVNGIEDVVFRYEIASNKGFLLKSDVSGGIPVGVLVEIHFRDEGGQHQLKRYLPVLVGI